MGVADLPEDLQKKLAKWESNKPENRSVRALEDLADMMQEVLSFLDDKSKDTSSKEMGAVLVDMRETLAKINAKEYPEMPDYSKPLLGGLTKLETALTRALKGIDVRPEFNPNINVDSPTVSVDAPDLSGVERAVREIPKAFKAAVELIPVTPATELTPLEDILKKMSDQLDSIDTASRMKPMSPTTLKVTNPDGTPIGSGLTENQTYAVRLDDTSTADTTYIGKASVGSSESNPVWQIAKLDTSSGLIKTWADGEDSFSNRWSERTTITYI